MHICAIIAWVGHIRTLVTLTTVGAEARHRQLSSALEQPKQAMWTVNQCVQNYFPVELDECLVLVMMQR
jgi:hypothetical protein